MYGDVSLNLKIGKNYNEPISISIPRNNAFGNIKRVYPKSIQLNKGEHEFILEVTNGNCYPDLIEIVPETSEKGTPEYYVHTYWHGVLRKSASNWKSNSLSFAVTDDSLYMMQRGKFKNDMLLRNFKEQSEATNQENYVGIYNNLGKAVMEKKSASDIKTLSIQNLPQGAYFNVISDKKTYWIAKQFVKY